MTKVQWYIEKEIKELAELEAANESTSVSEIFRRALRQYLLKKQNSKKNPFRKLVNKIDSPDDWKGIEPQKLSKEIDKELYGI